ncbi:MAG: hypothetical protein KC449_30905, partial [Anaerolineales bacterium]|nr:hypothetical protein [Anaerolineales bacterium]
MQLSDFSSLKNLCAFYHKQYRAARKVRHPRVKKRPFPHTVSLPLFNKKPNGRFQPLGSFHHMKKQRLTQIISQSLAAAGMAQFT